MDRAAEMTAFVRAVEVGGFSAAAREMGLTPSALSKLVTRLEDRLGARLLTRTTRRLQLTSEGEAFYNRARPILTAMDEAEAEVAEAGTRPRGLLRLHSGSAFGMHQLTPAIPRFLEKHRDIELEITINDVPPTPADDNFDLTIRRGALIPILSDWHHVEPVPLFVTYPSGRHLAPKVRVMVDFLVEEFGRAPWRV